MKQSEDGDGKGQGEDVLAGTEFWAHAAVASQWIVALEINFCNSALAPAVRQKGDSGGSRGVKPEGAPVGRVRRNAMQR